MGLRGRGVGVRVRRWVVSASRGVSTGSSLGRGSFSRVFGVGLTGRGVGAHPLALEGGAGVGRVEQVGSERAYLSSYFW